MKSTTNKENSGSKYVETVELHAGHHGHHQQAGQLGQGQRAGQPGHEGGHVTRGSVHRVVHGSKNQLWTSMKSHH